MQLQVSGRIPYGNVAAVESGVAGGNNHIAFTAAAHGGIERLWFCFRISNPAPRSLPPRTVLELKHVSTMLGGWTGKYHPVIRYEGGEWQRLPAGEVACRPDGHFSLRWVIDTPPTSAEVALCYPYGEPEAERLVAECGTYWKYDEIGVSQKGNPIRRLSNAYGEPGGGQPGLYVICRQHAAEVSGAWVLDGFLRRIAELGDRAPLVWCVPFTNLDGVLDGDYGKNPYPHDLNRAWDAQAPMRHETRLLMCDQQHWRERCRAAAFLDFHSPGMMEDDHYCFVSSDGTIPPEVAAATERLARRVEAALPDYAAADFIRKSDYKPFGVWGSFANATEYAANVLGIPGISFETSYHRAHGRILETKDYQTIGRLTADAVAAALCEPGKP